MCIQNERTLLWCSVGRCIMNLTGVFCLKQVHGGICFEFFTWYIVLNGLQVECLCSVCWAIRMKELGLFCLKQVQG